MGRLKMCTSALLALCLIIFSSCGNPASSTASAPQDASQMQTAPPAGSDIGGDVTSARIADSPIGTETMIPITVLIDGQEYAAKLYDNETTKALMGLFPLDIQMGELNSNEKYYYLPENLPTNAERVGTINAGDIMLYGSDCLVLFYESFPTSYSYTRLGYMEGVDELHGLLGDADIVVTFSSNQ